MPKQKKCTTNTTPSSPSFLSEYVILDDESEFDKASNYLKEWLVFTSRKFRNFYEIGDTELVFRPNATPITLALKVFVKNKVKDD